MDRITAGRKKRGNKKKKTSRHTSAGLQPRNNIIDSVSDGVGIQRTRRAQVELNTVCGVSRHGSLSLAHVVGEMPLCLVCVFLFPGVDNSGAAAGFLKK